MVDFGVRERILTTTYDLRPTTYQQKTMEFSDLKSMFGEVKTRMDGSIERVRKDLANVRTGRATVGLLDNVHVEAYGAKVPVNQVATLSIPEPSLIIAQ